MNNLSTSREEIPAERGCPEYDRCRQGCQAATSLYIPSRFQQMLYCVTFDYDNCPIYLGKALRSSRTQGYARDTIVDSGK